jgi:hypothetical protein
VRVASLAAEVAFLMYFLALSQAYTRAMEMATKSPVTMVPINRPPNARMRRQDP